MSVASSISPRRMFARSCASCVLTIRIRLTRAHTALPSAPRAQKSWTSPCTTLTPWCVARLLCRRHAKVAPWRLPTDRGTGSRAAKYFRHLELAVALRPTYRLDDGLDHLHYGRSHSLRRVPDAVG